MTQLSIFKEFLSTYQEIHAFIHGIYAGLTEWKGLEEAIWDNEDCYSEPHYVKGGYILGTIMRWIFIICCLNICRGI